MKRALLFLLAGCAARTLPPEGQLVVYVDTDAPLDLAPGAVLGPDDAAPLFDRLRVEILRADGSPACASCADDFSVTRDALARGDVSFGVRPPAGEAGLLVRARLFRGLRENGGEPPYDVTIDRAMALPTIGAEGITEVTVPLLLDAVGVPADLARAEPALAGKVVRAKLRDGVAPSPCTSDGDDAQVCVPGGAFWMGDPTVLLQSLDADPPARVAIVAPFWLDAAEVTVGALRASGLATKIDPIRGQTGCTYTDAQGKDEDVPVNCVSWSLAAQYCAAAGGRLPSEAEFELAAGGRASMRYPWGNEDPACGDAVFARADAVTAAKEIPQTAACAPLGTGPARAGAGTRDALALTGGTVLDLAGNVAEWTRDVWQDLGKDCWPAGLAIDPVCQPAGSGAASPRAVRGGSWSTLAPFLRSTSRASGGGGRGGASTGFRCARPGR